VEAPGGPLTGPGADPAVDHPGNGMFSLGCGRMERWPDGPRPSLRSSARSLSVGSLRGSRCAGRPGEIGVSPRTASRWLDQGLAERPAEEVGQRNLAVTANTYTHVLTDETELDYASLLD
jgi:hypothetical protein